MSDDDEPDELPAEQPTVSASSRRSSRRFADQHRTRKREDDAFWAGLFSTQVGRRAMWSILESAHAFAPTFACGPTGVPQPEATWFHAGEQQLGQRLYQGWLLRHTEQVALMHAENDPRFAHLKPKGDVQ